MREGCRGLLRLAAGLAVPVATLLLVAVMATAIAAVHWKNGVWAQDGGVELPLVMAVVAFAVAAVGPGSISLDNLLGIDWVGAGWAAAVVGAAGSLLLLGLARIGTMPAAAGRSRTPRSARRRRARSLEGAAGEASSLTAAAPPPPLSRSH